MIYLDSDEGIESTIMVIGNKSSGKTSLINRLRGKGKKKKKKKKHSHHQQILATKPLNLTLYILLFGLLDDPTQPTVALEYRYARSTRGNTKDICHIWELAGGTALVDLMDIPIAETNIHTLTFVIVIDLSEVGERERAICSNCI
jgi:dynein light intermediate chain 2